MPASCARHLEEVVKTAGMIGRHRIIKPIQDLSSDPRPPDCEKRSGRDDTFRVRRGTYRIVAEETPRAGLSP